MKSGSGIGRARVAAALLLAACGPPETPPVPPNEAESEVAAAVRRIADAVVHGDTAALRAAAVPGVALASVPSDAPAAAVQQHTLDDLLGGLPSVADEFELRAGDPAVRANGNLAAAWFPYEVHAGTAAPRCGDAALQLVRLEATWKVIALTVTGSLEPCRATAAERASIPEGSS